MRYRLCTLLILLAVLSPKLALARSEHHNREQVRQASKLQEWKRQADQINKLQRKGAYPYFRLDVF